MVCSACNDKPVEKACDTCGKLPPVLQINSEECPVLFHTVELEGTKEDNPPYIGMYKNTLLTYAADAAKFLFNSDGVYSAISGATEFDEILNRPKYGGVEMTSETDIPDVDAAVAGEAALREAADNALQNSIDAEAARATAAEQSLSSSLSSEVTARQAADSAIEGKLNGNVLYDLEMNADATAVEFVEDKKNLSTGTVTTETDTIPLASETQAGILNAAGYQSIKNSQDRLDALAGGAVSVSGLPANPTQAQLTTAWQTATELTEVFNRASIFDSTNGKNWTYFDNTEAWEVTGEVGQSITIENFSQGQAGLIVGDNQDGKVYAEQDGTGSVYGWDALKSRVTNAESNITTLDTDKQDKLTAGTNITIDQNTNTISASGGIPTDATFWGASYNATNNMVTGPINFSTSGAGVTNQYKISRDGYNLRLDCGLNGAIRFYRENSLIFTIASSIGASNHKITSVADPTAAQDAATKNYTDNLAISYAALNGSAAPTTATEGKYVGQLYYDTTNEQLYFLKEIDDTDPSNVEYTWEAVGGGSSVNVVQATGTSTTDVMSQAATTNMIYPSGSETSKNNIFIQGVGEAGNGYVCIGQNTTNDKVNTTYGSLALGTYAQATGTRAIAISGGSGITSATGSDSIAIGRNANAKGANSIAIGNSAGNTNSVSNAVAIGYAAYTVADSVAIGYAAATNNNQYGIAIGYQPRAFSENSIAIGHNIRINSLPGTVVIGNSNTANADYATRANEFCVHASTTANQPMVHSNVDTPTLGTDAANKDYVDTAVASAGAVAYTPSEFNNLWQEA